MAKRKPIYVECLIRSPLDKLWTYTQTPELHEQWDLRFSEITYLPKAHGEAPQRFRYKTKIGFGISIAGEGETAGTFENDSSKTSVLKFWSDNPISLIREGSGFWRYVPAEGGVRFFTRYDYSTRFGLPGRLADRWLFRPLMGWATAWSFDALRLWLDHSIHPRLSLHRSIMQLTCQVSLMFIWVYQGLFPKLLFPDAGELALLQSSGWFEGWETSLLHAMGIAEIVWGLLLLAGRPLRSRLYSWSIPLLIALGLAACSKPDIFIAPFNPVTLNLAMIALSICGKLSLTDLPDASSCLRSPVYPTHPLDEVKAPEQQRR